MIGRRTLIDSERDVEVTVPVAPEVQEAIHRATVEAFMAAGQGVLDEALKPFGLTGLDIAIPTYTQVVYEDEVPIYLALLKRSG